MCCDVGSGDSSLGIFHTNQYLEAGANYTKIASVRIPERIFGLFHILVFTDAYNQVYEHTSEDDNLGFLMVNQII